MTTHIVPYQDMMAMAKDIVASGLFGMKNEHQVLALMAVAQAEGKHPAIIARDYDIIQGRPAKKSEAMLRDFIAGGGKVEWHTMDDTKADATFSHPAGGTTRISWDMERAKNAQLTSKDMYKKYPRQMLRARVVSEGVRAVGPFATSGMYVPEEVREFGPAKELASNGSRDVHLLHTDPVQVIEAQPAVPASPEGYEKWADGLSAVADEGRARLLATWKASEMPYRQYMSKYEPSRWERMKERASAVTVGE